MDGTKSTYSKIYQPSLRNDGSKSSYSKYCQPSYKKNVRSSIPASGSSLVDTSSTPAPAYGTVMNNSSSSGSAVIGEYAQLLGGWDSAYENDCDKLISLSTIATNRSYPSDVAVLLAGAVENMKTRDQKIDDLSLDLVDFNDYKKWFGALAPKRIDVEAKSEIDMRYVQYAARYGMPENGVFDEALLNEL